MNGIELLTVAPTLFSAAGLTVIVLVLYRVTKLEGDVKDVNKTVIDVDKRLAVVESEMERIDL